MVNINIERINTGFVLTMQLVHLGRTWKFHGQIHDISTFVDLVVSEEFNYDMSLEKIVRLIEEYLKQCHIDGSPKPIR